MADGRITDYTNVEVSTGAIIDPSWANTETGNIETSINNGNDVMIDLEQNYASSSAPTSAPNGKIWYDSGASADYAKLRAAGAWSIIAHDSMATNFTFGQGLTVASNFAVSGSADFAGDVSVGAGLAVASNFAVSGQFTNAADFAGEVSVGAGLIVASNCAVSGTGDFAGQVSCGAGLHVTSVFAVSSPSISYYAIEANTVGAVSIYQGPHKKYSATGDYTISNSPTAVSSYASSAITYQTSDGTWMLKIWGYIYFGANMGATETITITGVTFDGYTVALVMRDNRTGDVPDGTTASGTGYTVDSAGQIVFEPGNAREACWFYCEAPLTGKPSWAD